MEWYLYFYCLLFLIILSVQHEIIYVAHDTLTSVLLLTQHFYIYISSWPYKAAPNILTLSSQLKIPRFSSFK